MVWSWMVLWMMWLMVDDMSLMAMEFVSNVLLFILNSFENQRVIPVCVLRVIALCVMVPMVVCVR